MKLYAACAGALFGLAACSTGGGSGSSAGSDGGDAAALPTEAGTAGSPTGLTREQLRDPETCQGCHPNHYREWSSSMHAYAAKDPVFIAMNRRGQRETGGELGDFCVKCHAPMAVIDQRTSDGLNLDELPDRERGVSCYFCHNVAGIDGDHDAMLHLANDTTMRGPFSDPRPALAHQAEYSAMFDEYSPQSTRLCGDCHDIVLPDGVHLERTFEEYRSGFFSMMADGQGPESPQFESCPGCHMSGRTELAAVQPAGAPLRTVHEHLWPGIDLPLVDFPHSDALQAAVERCQLGAASIGFFTLEVTPPDLFTFHVETNAGHNQPSGAAQDRRMWLELMAYDAQGELIEQESSGNIGDGEIADKPEGDPEYDPNLFMLRDRLYDAQGHDVHMFWQAAMSSAHPNGYESNVLPVRTTTLGVGDHSVEKQYRVSGPDGLPARVTARLRIRPVGVDVLEDLVQSGDLDPAVVERMQTLTFGAQLEWTQQDGVMKTISAMPESDCASYRCLLYPGSKDCN